MDSSFFLLDVCQSDAQSFLQFGPWAIAAMVAALAPPHPVSLGVEQINATVAPDRCYIYRPVGTRCHKYCGTGPDQMLNQHGLAHVA
jgi:hypothetical protein|tara:strand:- start:289 stop:549 length:261 start_codon:yes stop_codon:yes gene_type:complete